MSGRQPNNDDDRSSDRDQSSERDEDRNREVYKKSIEGSDIGMMNVEYCQKHRLYYPRGDSCPQCRGRETGLLAGLLQVARGMAIVHTAGAQPDQLASPPPTSTTDLPLWHPRHSATCNDHDVAQTDPEIMCGTPCFAGTRVRIKNLFDYLADGKPLDEFLRQFPSVTREQAVAVLGLARAALVGGRRATGNPA